MGRKRIVQNQDGTFSTACPTCGKTRFLKTNPRKKRDCVCPSCVRKGKESKLKFVFPQGIIERYLSGESANALSIELNITPNTFIAALKREGIKPRTMSAAIALAGCAEAANQKSNELRETGEMSVLLSAGHQGISVSEWSEFSTSKWDRIRSTRSWGNWRKAVYERDGYKCVLCRKSGKGKVRLSPHHIKRKADSPELMFNVDNGVTLCHSCHCLVNQKEADYEKMFMEYVSSAGIG